MILVWLGGTIVISIIGLALIFYLTSDGLTVTGDSVRYVMGAENILAGNGYARTLGNGLSTPIKGFPPLYSSILAGTMLFGFEPFAGARLLNAVLYAGSIALASILVLRATSSPVTALAAGFMVVVISPVLIIHTWAMSEPLYIFLSLVAILLLDIYLENGQLKWILFAAGIAGISTLARLVGASLILTGLASILILAKLDRWTKLGHALGFGLISMAPLVLWFARNLASSGQVANRRLGFHPISQERLDLHLAAFADWFVARKILPWRPRLTLALGLALVGPVVAMVQDLRGSRPARFAGNLERLLLLYISAYLLVLIVNIFFLDASVVSIDPGRHPLPALLATAILFVIALSRLWHSQMPRYISGSIVAGATVIFFGLHMWTTIQILTSPNLNKGYRTIQLENPDLAKAIMAIDPERVLTSNNPELVYLLSGKPAYIYPIIFDQATDREREDLEHQVAALEQRLATGGRLIIFGEMDQSEQQLLESMYLAKHSSLLGADVYGYPLSLENFSE
jgi:4-amino-4-deoxy-L-arabinose transferase-like glycosyltransferase